MKKIIIGALLFWASHAFAVIIYYSPVPAGSPVVASCDLRVVCKAAIPTSKTHRYTGETWGSGIDAGCVIEDLDSKGNFIRTRNAGVSKSTGAAECPKGKCQSGDQIALKNFGIKWSNQKSGMIVPKYPPTPMCKDGCEVTVIWSNNFRFKDTPLAKNDWKLLADDAVLTKNGNSCNGTFPTDPPAPESPPGMNCGFYNGHQVCIGKDKSYICKKMSDGQMACLPTQDLDKGQVCGEVNGKYVCMDMNKPDADLCEKQPDGSMKCIPKKNLYENDTGSKDKEDKEGKTDGDKADTEESDKDTATTPGTSAPGQNKGWGEKYKHGLGGIWMVKSKEMQNTGLAQFAKKVLPTDIHAGSNPSWSFEFDAPYIGYISHDLQIPSEVWFGLKLIVLAMASIFAFKLIFGGS